MKTRTYSKNDILCLLFILLSYSMNMSAAKQRAELSRYNQLSDAALLEKGKQLANSNNVKLALNCFELLQNRGDLVAFINALIITSARRSHLACSVWI